ncbi:hypothetical protein HK103_007041 [Boothiomyces macroporosus]|uniref:Uncharacterized protein n=1 Tax=Boothiomyces macroporosus TaxID=261099 RepID=A0AAD5Y688_9FUNG|nr:hypothetical protein HK103_007041 [Boothiomyces macroporosus]
MLENTPPKQNRKYFVLSSPMSPLIKDTSFVSKITKDQGSFSPQKHEMTPMTFLPHTFQHATKPTQLAVQKENIEDGFIYKQVEFTFAKWQCEKYLDVWGENMRKWLSRMLNQYIARIDAVENKFKEMNLNHLLLAAPKSNATPTLVDLKNQYPNEPIVTERIYLENVLKEFNCKEYILNRIRSLSEGSCLSQYKWNGGADYGTKFNQQTYPTDSQLLMYLFCVYMDEKYPTASQFTMKYFTNSLKPSKMLLIRTNEYLENQAS